MSSFKKLSKADVTTVPYAANKQWVLPYSCPSISNNYFNIYKGTYITGTFSPNNFITDPITNGQYERLIYDSINHLFYQKYSGSLDTGSLMFDINTYQSASQQRPTSSYFDYNINPNLVKNFPTGVGDGIRVLAINQDIYGSKILPYSFNLSSSAYYITDDGNGNIYSGSTHIGNVFYAHGLAVITNPDYQNMFPLPPIAVNDVATFLTSNTGSNIIRVLDNDISRSCALDTGSIVLSGSNSVYYTVLGNGTIRLNASASGNYDVYYTVNSICNNGCGLTSNKAKVTTNVIQVNPPPCISVEFYGSKGDTNTFWYKLCGSTNIDSVTLSDYDPPVQRCIDGTFGVSGSSQYSYIGACTSGSVITGSSYSVNIYGKVGGSLNADYSTEIYYAIGTGSSTYLNYLDSTDEAACNYKGSVSVPSGSTLSVWLAKTYPVAYYNSYNAVSSSTCPTNLAAYCGNSPFTVTVGSSMNISLTAYVSSSGTFKICP